MEKRASRLAWRGRQAFTLTEVLVATALTTVLMAQVGSALVATLRGVEATVADMELALETRVVREKLLYRIADDGGLMSACQSGLSVGNGGGNKGDSVTFKPVKGQQNKLELNGTKKKIVANRSSKDKWLERGKVVFQGTDIFTLSNDVLYVNLDMALPVGTRNYTHRHRCRAQIMNNK